MIRGLIVVLSVALSAAASAQQAAPKPSRLERIAATGQFVIGASKVRPRVGETFKRNEKMGIFVKLYNFTPDEKTHKPDGVIEYQVVRKNSNESVFDYKEEVGSMQGVASSQVTVEKMLPLLERANRRE